MIDLVEVKYAVILLYLKKKVFELKMQVLYKSKYKLIVIHKYLYIYNT